MPPDLPAASAPVLEARDLVKTYGSLAAVDGVSLAIRPGSVTAILGPSGSGKSTLLRCLNFLVVPDSGTVLLEGRPADPRHDHALDAHRARVGMVFQQFHLFPHLSIRENVALAPRVARRLPHAEADALAARQLVRVGLADKLDAYPDQLSGGQQQRAAIARALAMEPAVLLFDEPTSALDPELTGEVLAVMRQLAAERVTMVVVTHDVAFARAAASEVVFMDAGKIVEQGPPAQVLDAPLTDRARRFFATG
ncbi:MAG: amino acid ABC transporter ATP-binding protein [Opitutaceae bacterium]|jgi:polar amino acid transport system ATP-binding protein|nr:amino acid ABC transporter ATP-binding protein [Opitutaceae bacterium]